MKRSLPPLLVVANRGRLVAYRRTEAGALQAIDHYQPDEGNQNLSEILTDQAGAFSNGGPGTSSHESLPLVEELELRSEKKVAARIGEILTREAPPFWGFAAASELNGAILGHLPPEWTGRLRFNLKVDLTNVPAREVLHRFEVEATIPAHAG